MRKRRIDVVSSDDELEKMRKRMKWYCPPDLICDRTPYSWTRCRWRGVKLDIELKQELKQKNRLSHIPLPTPPHWTPEIARLRCGIVVGR
jgi:hypothetical protein